MNNLVQLNTIGTRTDLTTGRDFRRPDLFVGRLHLTDFRSYHRVTLTPEARSVVLTGPNGAGKTNILEALSFLAPGRGLRGCKLSDPSRLTDDRHAGRWAVAARLETPDGTTDLGTGLVAGADGDSLDREARDRRIIRVDGENGASPAHFSDILQVAWLTPQMDRLFIEATSGRRRFLDRIVGNFHSAHAREVNAYERVMRDRNRLLSEGSRDPAWLTALESRMAEHGVAVAAARLDALDRLSQAIGAATSSFPQATLAVDGGLEQGLMRGPAVEVEDEFRRVLRENRGLDARSGRAMAGPHRTDLLVTHQEKNMPAALCSTGEQKALLIGITLASARITATAFGAAPVLLLDEVVAHLDQARRAALFDELAALGAQVWLTGTDRVLFEDLGSRARYYRVDNSIVSEE
ncbi:DNA replication/repair protein RecF [Paremcibacter congregatus]|uniref:DNA replication/repair protein RecF n=1 Tax=Paremcibacter congregatus TaxID=2043170 RepID=UPI0030ED4338